MKKRRERYRAFSLVASRDYSITEKLSLPIPQSGHDQLSGICSKGVPGAIPLSGSPFSGS